MSKVHRKLKYLRAKLGLTQQEMAKKLGMDQSTYSAKENGKREFVKSEIDKILEIFGETYENVF